MKYFIIAIVLLLPLVSFAQEGFKYKSTIDSIPGNGYCKILLNPYIIAHTKKDLSDLRIYNHKKEEIAYVVVKETANMQILYSSELKIIEDNPFYTPKISKLIIANPNKINLSKILFTVRNTSLVPEVIIKGSDDQKNWYFISRGYLEKMYNSNNDTSEYRNIEFPLSNYPYFEISILHRRSEQIQILNAGYYDTKVANGHYSLLPAPTILQKDSLKKSFITLVFDAPYLIDKLAFSIENTGNYLRNCRIGRYVVHKNRKKTFETIYNVTLKSGASNYYNFYFDNADTLYMEIDNDDNAPLKLKSVTAYQLNTYLIASLNKPDNYTIYYGNNSLNRPEYDLKYFIDNLTLPSLPLVTCSEPSQIEGFTAERSTKNFFEKNLIWFAIALIIIVLGFISVKIIKEVNEKQPDN